MTPMTPMTPTPRTTATTPEPAPSEQERAARAVLVLAYAAGVAGAAAGTIVLRAGELALAVVIWTLVLAVGAALVGTATLLRASAASMRRLARLEDEVVLLATRLGRDRP